MDKARDPGFDHHDGGAGMGSRADGGPARAHHGLPVCPITEKKALTNVVGVSKAEINFDKRQATVTFDDAKTNAAALTQATTHAGYPSTLDK